MDTKSLAHDGRPCGNPRFTDDAFFTEVSELTGIEYRALYRSFAGERKDLALDVVKSIVSEDLEGTPAAWTEKLIERAKAGGLGEHRPGYWEGYELTYEHNDYLRSIGRL